MREDEPNEERGHRNGRRFEGRNEGMKVKSNYFMPKPVKVGDVVDVKIEAVASKGDGIAKIDGFVIFVKGAKEGEEVKVKITDVKARFATGELA
ncbi:TRAM domain-containing protein [Candidatus Marsarchaeota archaeon]|jgi:predicted RNA-binding protein with TRAM domain|nr:TRAM domain-containing protein [Candidatus Marsarchaeota archaeon]MCL5090341.1 TRAM domain-containing protein [Candidatus Marsarchaeota archaeon]